MAAIDPRRYVDGDDLLRMLEILAWSPVATEDWQQLRSALVDAWPRQDVGDGAEQGGSGEVLPVEADVDVPEM